MSKRGATPAGGKNTPPWGAAQILQVDKRILRVVVVSTSKEILEMGSRGLAPILPSSEELRGPDLGALIDAVLNAMAKVRRYFGESLYSVFSFQEYKILVLGPFDFDRVLGIILPRRVSADDVYREVVHFIETTSAKTPG
jgi:hypothetical protein